jgi:cobalt-zinc-cadmium efflux system outer membrane protein
MRTTHSLAQLFWLLAIPPALSAQAPARAPLTLAEARARAVQVAPSIAAARQALAAAEGRLVQAGAYLNPVVTFSREQTSRDGATNSQNILALEQPFEIGGQRGARRDAASARRDAVRAGMALDSATVDFEVTRTYAAAVAAGRRAALATDAAGAFARAVAAGAERLAAGDISGYEQRRLRLEAARYAVVRAEAEIARDSAMRTLAALTGIDSTATLAMIPLADTLVLAPLALTVEALTARALEQNPALLVQEFEARALAADASLAAAERRPTPALIAGFKNERVATGEAFTGFVAGLSMPIPLWDRRAGAVAATSADAARGRALTAESRQRTIREVRAAYDAVQSLERQLLLLRPQLGEDASRARSAAEAAYREGEISLLEWLDAVRAYHEAETSYAMLLAEYAARRAALERATGAPLL